MSQTWSAPGKFVLLGEYAVLDGAPALVAAANRRALVGIQDADGPASSVETRGIASLRASFVPDARGRPLWQNASPDVREALGLVADLLPQLQAAGLYEASRPFHAVLDTSGFYEQTPDGQTAKIGLGSSAALTVAFAAAVADHCGRTARSQSLTELLALHREWQGGQGSGVDIAAALQGGLLEYTRTPEGSAHTQARTLPNGVLLQCVWTGHEASTRDFLRGLARWRQAQPSDYRSVMDNMAAAARQGVAAAAAGMADSFLAALAQYGERMAMLGQEAGLEIVNGDHAWIGNCARDHGLVYKPSGAGGGDLGVAAGTDAASIKAFRGAVAARSYKALDIAISADGLRKVNEND